MPAPEISPGSPITSLLGSDDSPQPPLGICPPGAWSRNEELSGYCFIPLIRTLLIHARLLPLGGYPSTAGIPKTVKKNTRSTDSFLKKNIRVFFCLFSQ